MTPKLVLLAGGKGKRRTEALHAAPQTATDGLAAMRFLATQNMRTIAAPGDNIFANINRL